MMIKRTYLIIIALIFAFSISKGQSFKFAHVTDTHVGSGTGADDLRRTVKDLNTLQGIDFVILSGDITEFGADHELKLAKQILDSLQLPWYVIPGNHDGNWSENGANTFRRVFGGETFFFKHKGFMFLGTNSGPNMRMSPGQIPRENLVWMDSIFNANPDKNTPLIYINHYPQDSSLNNWFEALDRVKTRNVQLALCGHGHTNKMYNWEGIPGVMGRSNLRANKEFGGYNIVTIDSDKATYQERLANGTNLNPWAVIPLKNHHFESDKGSYPRPNYAVNKKYANLVSETWAFQDASDIGAGMALYRDLVITANTSGDIFALDSKTGKKKWSFKTGGKVYSTPAVSNGIVVAGSSDHYIYGLNAENGALKWKIATEKAVLGSPLIHNNTVYIGGSDGVFRALNVTTGQQKWDFKNVKGYVSTLPTFYKGLIIFGSWGNGFYALNAKTGALVWEWNNGQSNRMFSAAACYPVAVNNRVFVVAPDRFMTALDAKDGRVIWREKRDTIRVRESMGLSLDHKYVYVKTMDGDLLGVSARENHMEISWKSTLKLPYELTPSAISTNGKVVFVPSHSGLLSAVDAKSGRLLWQYKISNGMINPLLVVGKNGLICSTMDGKIVKLKF
ncbi:PQQ-binding-like beta-propeller repeat protein [Sphingobacterium sp. SRCM116780]|uniref:outer membrane protein assembly factor BamB family protein n=1 Tax=Sphingobacterium sp. SRCM116780 TaxID=2907623 RepID=UPI001F3302FB|nr:PQQ-binding-like beta-propeller repeat protein [Sphingobacterium sp. SRCM116780]UIR56090.1 PQQ-binding-like beta-propeller repeat protein [Sphingobacterium sp. SRCM116780]